MRIFSSRRHQFDEVVRSVRECLNRGRAVLIGTDSVSAADALSKHLHAANIAHQLITARDDKFESQLVAQAGIPRMVTVTTNIAGRGTDIPVHARTLGAGGLHVICCAQNGSPRIDRQLFGRTARNGQPGSCEAALALDDPAISAVIPQTLIACMARLANRDGQLPRALAAALCLSCRAVSQWNELVLGYQLLLTEQQHEESLTYAISSE